MAKRQFETVYVGKGTVPRSAVENNLDIIRLNLHMDQLERMAYNMKTESGEVHRLVTLEVSRMKSPDKFGRSHTVYGSVLVQEEPPKKAGKRKPNADDEMPF